MADGVLDECIHGMTLGFCTICKQNTTAARNARAWNNAADVARDADRWAMILPPFTLAKFDGECPECGKDIEDRELIGLRDGEWFCNKCSYDYDIEATKQRHPSGKDSAS